MHNYILKTLRKPEGFVYLQRKIILIVLFKVDCLGFQRDTLDGIVTEFAAFSAGYNAFLCTQHLLALQLCAKGQNLPKWQRDDA